MSNAVFNIPLPPNGAFLASPESPLTKTPRFATIKTDSASLRGQTRISLSPFPVWDIQWDLAYLIGNDGTLGSAYQNVIGFYMQMKGSADDFLLPMPGDNTISTPVSFGIGDAATKSFQLTRPFAGGLDIIQNVNGSPSIFVNGVLQAVTAYTISRTGVVTFAAAPAALATLTWSGNFYYRVHFVDDSLQLQYIAPNTWTITSLKMESLILPA